MIEKWTPEQIALVLGAAGAFCATVIGAMAVAAVTGAGKVSFIVRALGRKRRVVVEDAD